MPEVVEAVYEDGVLRPLEKLELRDGEVVKLVIFRKALAFAGALKDVPDKYIEEALREVEEGAYIR